MKEFPIIKANQNSISRRRSVHGVGINDADYKVNPIINKERFYCPFYTRWQTMIQRCYSEKYQNKKPAYIGCSVCNEWLTFSVFRAWMIKQNWRNKQIDKDLKYTGNKIYSPGTCIFVTSQINNITVDSKGRRGKYPIGVNLHSGGNRFSALCSVNGKQKTLGYFKTPEAASEVYKAFKSNHVESIANQQSEPLKSYLIRIASEIRSS
jgi:hypothetical protein